MQIAESELDSLKTTLEELKIKALNGEIDESIVKTMQNTIDEREKYYYSDDYAKYCLDNATDTIYYQNYNNTWQEVLATLGIVISGGGAMLGAPLVMAMTDSLKERNESLQKIVDEYNSSAEALVNLITKLKLQNDTKKREIAPSAGKPNDNPSER